MSHHGEHGSSDGGAKEALKNDWEQTKSDMPGADGKDMDQGVGDTAKQMADKEPTDGSQN